MGSFDDLPKDVMWLILREALQMAYGMIKVFSGVNRPQFITARNPTCMASLVIPLSRVCKRFRLVLKSKSRWTVDEGRLQWGFV